MGNNELEILLKKVSEAAKKIPRSAKIIKGSLVYLSRKCGNARCKCNNGEKHTSLYLSRSVNGKTTMTYIGPQFEKEAQNSVKRYNDIIKQLDEISKLNLEIIKIKRSEKK